MKPEPELHTSAPGRAWHWHTRSWALLSSPMFPAAQAPGLHRPHTCRLVPGSLIGLCIHLQGRGPGPGPGPAVPAAKPSLSLASQDRTCEIVEDTESSRMVKKMKKRICLVLDCLCAHDFSDKTADLINLQHYVIKEKRLSERETVVIFYDVVRVVEALHQKNIVHRDLKLGNMVLNKRTHRITITNFCLGKHLVSEGDLLKDQRGSPAYISPDVLSGRPYRGKPSDMWALGVVLFTMLYGQFPFYDSIPQELFRKIKAAEYTIPEDGRVSENTVCLIRKLLVLDPQQRLAATDVLEALSAIIASWQSLSSLSGPLQVVPDIDDQMSHADSSQEAKVTEECSQYEFENYMRQQLLLAEEKSSIHEARSWVPKRQFGSVPPVRRLGHDAQPMNPLDAAILAQRYLRK
uniref:Serine/threonine-protein kinase 40 n=1 Tax=Equus caballus TaxID=9796 RepID=A0A9L0SFJ1_HORSE